VHRELPGPGRKPLSCACHSAFLAPDQPRAPGVRRVVELLLDAGADPNETFRNEYGDMPVLYGAAGVAHDPETARLLLDRGASPDDGESVYHSVEAQDTDCLELLLERGATVRDSNALGNAIGNPAFVRVLLERGDLRPADPELRDALLWARKDEVAELLIAHGADLEVRDRDGLTPYSRAARIGDHSLMALLERAGADTTADATAAWLGAVVRGDAAAAERHRPSAAGWRRSDAELLPIFASAGEDEVVERLLAAGVPLHARGVDDGTALHYAGMWGRGSTVELLLAQGAEPNLMAGPPEHPSAALGWTCWGSRGLDGEGERVEGYVAAARALLAAGASVMPGMAEIASDDVAVLLEDVGPRDERVYETGPVLVRVRRRGGRCEIDDRGWAVAEAGHPPGWREAAERTALGWNVARTGTVFVAVAADRDIDDLVRRTADAALAVRDAILALEE
jgi:ankyrin repeat protein